MGATAEELRLDIERKRLELGDDLTALGDHVSPAQIAQRKKAEYRFRAERAWQTIQTKVHAATAAPADAASPDVDRGPVRLLDNPLAVGAISLASGLLVGAVWSRRRTRRRMRRRMNRSS